MMIVVIIVTKHIKNNNIQGSDTVTVVYLQFTQFK